MAPGQPEASLHRHQASRQWFLRKPQAKSSRRIRACGRPPASPPGSKWPGFDVLAPRPQDPGSWLDQGIRVTTALRSLHTAGHPSRGGIHSPGAALSCTLLSVCPRVGAASTQPPPFLEHLLLARPPTTLVRPSQRQDETIPRRQTCSDFRESLLNSHTCRPKLPLRAPPLAPRADGHVMLHALPVLVRKPCSASSKTAGGSQDRVTDVLTSLHSNMVRKSLRTCRSWCSPRQ